MMNRCLLPLCACLLGILAFAQENPVLMRVNGREVSRSEFEYSYHHYRAGGGGIFPLKNMHCCFLRQYRKLKLLKLSDSIQLLPFANNKKRIGLS